MVSDMSTNIDKLSEYCPDIRTDDFCFPVIVSDMILNKHLLFPIVLSWIIIKNKSTLDVL